MSTLVAINLSLFGGQKLAIHAKGREVSGFPGFPGLFGRLSAFSSSSSRTWNGKKLAWEAKNATACSSS